MRKRRSTSRSRSYVVGKGSYTVLGPNKRRALKNVGRADRAPGISMGMPRLKLQRIPKK